MSGISSNLDALYAGLTIGSEFTPGVQAKYNIQLFPIIPNTQQSMVNDKVRFDQK